MAKLLVVARTWLRSLGLLSKQSEDLEIKAALKHPMVASHVKTLDDVPEDEWWVFTDRATREALQRGWEDCAAGRVTPYDASKYAHLMEDDE